MNRNLKDSIFVQVGGGIGNQLFMYVAGLALSLKEGAQLYCCRDPDDKAQILHPGNLNEFNCRFVEEAFIPKSKLELLNSKLQARLTRCLPKSLHFLVSKFRFYTNYDLGYDAKVFKLRPPIYLNGYFQSYKYFEYCREFLSVKEILSLKSPSIDFVNFEKILSEESFCAIHVRRGDYVNHQESLGILDSIYYRNALDKISGLKSSLRFIVFSDDPKLAKDLLIGLLPSNTLWPIDLMSLTDSENIVLMSKAKAIVIANSSFSLFAALLTDNNAMVVRPDFWSIDSENPIDLFKPSWHKASRFKLNS